MFMILALLKISINTVRDNKENLFDSKYLMNLLISISEIISNPTQGDSVIP